MQKGSYFIQKEYREVTCSGCTAKLRLTVTEENYGRKVETTCPRCKARTETTIEAPPSIPVHICEIDSGNEELPIDVNQKLKEVTKRILSDQYIIERLAYIRKRGHSTVIGIGTVVSSSNDSENNVKDRILEVLEKRQRNNPIVA